MIRYILKHTINSPDSGLFERIVTIDGDGGCSIYTLIGVECREPDADRTIEMLMGELQRIAALAQTASAEFRETFDPDGIGNMPAGWRVAEKMREVALDAMRKIPARYYA